MTKRLLFLLLTLAIVLLCLAGCNSPSEDQPTDLPTDSATDKVTDKAPQEFNDGKLRIFADGNYYCRIVRPEGATRRELDMYTAIRNIFKEVTGVMPPLATDFLSAGESYDPNEFAILIGKTKHEESAALYSGINYSDFSAKLINKKYALGFHDADTAANALTKLRALIKNSYKDGQIILDESWNYSHSEKEVLENVPRYDGGVFTDVYEGAYGMQTISIMNTNASEYNAYLTKIAAEGFTPYTDNTIGENLFATYKNENYILTAMYFARLNETRVTLEKTGNYSLPALEEENVYTSTDAECSITQIGLEESTGVQNGMSYVFKLADGSFLIIDGGTSTRNSIAQFYEVMESLADDPDNITVATWIITHAHGDHLGLFYSLLMDEKFYEKFTVEQVIWSKVSDKQLANLGEGNSLDYMDKMLARLEGARIVIAHPGQQFFIRNAVYTVLATVELVEPFTLTNLNETSIVGRLVVDGKSFMFPGDSHAIETDKVTAIYADYIKSDVVQVIHHGYQGGTDAFYSLVDPITVLWPLGMKNYETAEPPNTPMKTWSYSRWLFSEDSKVENIYVAGSDVLTLLIKDIPSHENS